MGITDYFLTIKIAWGSFEQVEQEHLLPILGHPWEKPSSLVWSDVADAIAGDCRRDREAN